MTDRIACACGMVYPPDMWERLDMCGIQSLEWGEVLELRNCVCGSTLAKVLEEGEPE